MKIIKSRNAREGRYIAATVIGFLPARNKNTGDFGMPTGKKPNVRAGTDNLIAYFYTSFGAFAAISRVPGRHRQSGEQYLSAS